MTVSLLKYAYREQQTLTPSEREEIRSGLQANLAEDHPGAQVTLRRRNDVWELVVTGGAYVVTGSPVGGMNVVIEQSPT